MTNEDLVIFLWFYITNKIQIFFWLNLEISYFLTILPKKRFKILNAFYATLTLMTFLLVKQKHLFSKFQTHYVLRVIPDMSKNIIFDESSEPHRLYLHASAWTNDFDFLDTFMDFYYKFIAWISFLLYLSVDGNIRRVIIYNDPMKNGID